MNSTQISISSTNGLLCLFAKLFNFMFYLLIALSVLMIIWAAYNYLTAQDDAEKVAKATKTLTYVAIAVAVALCAKAFPLLIGSIFSADLSEANTTCTSVTSNINYNM